MTIADAVEPGESKRRRAPEERAQQILEAAYHEFGEHGLAGARLDDIAKRANVAKGTIYLYFPNKEELFREMVRQCLVASLEQVEAELPQYDQAPAETQLRYLFQNWWRFLGSERFTVVHRLVIGELHNFPDLMKFYSDEVISRGRRLIGRVVARGTARKEFREIEPEVAARMLSALTLSHSIWCARKNLFPALQGQDNETLREQVFDFYLHALRPDRT